MNTYVKKRIKNQIRYYLKKIQRSANFVLFQLENLPLHCKSNS